MCGITGISYKNGKVTAEQLIKAGSLLKHRGPDDSGYFISSSGKTGFAHQRLSFLDLSALGKQPLSNNDQSLVITYNGEIYNYLELRDTLEKLGYEFKTKTDTEVILHGYHAWGNALPQKLDGMFAFAIYDDQHQTIFICRDRFGIKPLYYSLGSNEFIFGSEIKSILALNGNLKKIRPGSISLFLANRYVPAPHTIWEEIKKLRPGHSLSIDLNSFSATENKYWHLASGKIKISLEETYENFRNLLLKSVGKHLRSDVPVGSFLSGGYDSSALVMLMKKDLHYPTSAFSIGFKDWDQSEDQYAKLVSDAVGADLYTSMPNNIQLDIVKKLMWHYDDPIADISIIPTYDVSRLASTKVKAVLSGEGADEMMGGYWWHKSEKFHHQNLFKKWSSSFTGKSFHDIKLHYINAMSMGLFDTAELKNALGPQYHTFIPQDPFSHFDQFAIQDESPVKQLQYLDIHTFMSELILSKVDRASMAHSLEVRVPFLQHELVEFLFSLDPSSYLVDGEQKPLLRKLLQGHVPEKILNRAKQGFVGPDQYYMDYTLYEKTLINGRLVNEEVIRKEYVSELLKKKDHWRLWKLFVLENWWQIWM